MLILAIDTSLAHCSVAVGSLAAGPADVASLAVSSVPLERGQGDRVVPLIDATIKEASIKPAELDRILVTTGPGGFSGVRAGIAAARGMALALDCPCLGITSLEALIAGLPTSEGPATDFSIIDARRGMVFLLTRGQVPEICGLESAARAIAQAAGTGPVRVTGPGVGLLDPVLGARSNPVLHPVAAIDPHALFSFALDDPGARPPRPLYLRPPDATPAKPPPWLKKDGTQAAGALPPQDRDRV